MLVPGLYDPLRKGWHTCLVCGEEFSKWKSLNAHLTMTGCGATQIGEMLTEQEILMEERDLVRWEWTKAVSGAGS